MDQPGIFKQLRRLGAQRRAREIVLAVMLTLAAFVFLASAMFGKDATDVSAAHGERHYDSASRHQ